MQQAGYLDVLNSDPTEFNPSDYAYHLTRRARGLPFWFSLAAHGTQAYSDAIEARWRSRARRRRRCAGARTWSCCASRTCRWWCSGGIGWTEQQYYDWSDRLMQAHYAFVTPTAHGGEVVTRFAIVQPADDGRRHHRHPRHHGLTPQVPASPCGMLRGRVPSPAVATIRRVKRDL